MGRFSRWWHSKQLKSDVPQRRMEYVIELSRLKDGKSGAALLEAVGDENAAVAAVAAAALAERREPKAIGPIVARLLESSDVDVRDAFLAALGRYRSAEVMKPLVARVRADDLVVRMTAAWALRKLCWEDLEPGHRAEVAVILEDWHQAQVVGAAAVKPLSRALETATRLIQRQAAKTLCAIGTRESFDALYGIASSGKCAPSAREIAAWALRGTNWPWMEETHCAMTALILGDERTAQELGAKAIPALINGLRDPLSQVRLCAARSLGAYDDDDVIDALGLLVSNRRADAELRAEAAAALGRIGNACVTESLACSLEDPDGDVRLAAVAALVRIGATPANTKHRILMDILRKQWEQVCAEGSKAIDALVIALRLSAHPEVADLLAGLGESGLRALRKVSASKDCDAAARREAIRAIHEHCLNKTAGGEQGQATKPPDVDHGSPNAAAPKPSPNRLNAATLQRAKAKPTSSELRRMVRGGRRPIVPIS